MSDPKTLVWLHNLPYAVTSSELWDAIRALDIGALRVSLGHDGAGKSRGHAIVFFRTADDAERAIGTLDGAEMLGRRLHASRYRTEFHPGVRTR